MVDKIELTKLRMIEGVWHGVIKNHSRADWTPSIEVTHLEQPVEGVTVQEDPVEQQWRVSVPIPVASISDGVQTFLIREGDQVLESFAIIAGDALAQDMRAEMALMRAELDMLKKAFRRHCVETAGD